MTVEPIKLRKEPEWHSTRASIEHKIKYLALSLIIAANAAILAGVLVSLILYCPIPDQTFITRSVIITSFVIGIIGAANVLKLPTLGVTSFNVGQHLNPISLMGKVIGLIMFAPTISALKLLDLTNYGDADIAGKICETIENKSFEDILTFEAGVTESAQKEKRFLNRFATYRHAGLIRPGTERVGNRLYERFIALKTEEIYVLRKISEQAEETEVQEEQAIEEDTELSEAEAAEEAKAEEGEEIEEIEGSDEAEEAERDEGSISSTSTRKFDFRERLEDIKMGLADIETDWQTEQARIKGTLPNPEVSHPDFSKARNRNYENVKHLVTQQFSFIF